MIVEQKTKKAFVPVTITLETEEELILLKELTSFVDTESIEALEESLAYEVTEDVTIDDIDTFSEKLYNELYDIINYTI